jgi:DNA-binding response OmpR family regulator
MKIKILIVEDNPDMVDMHQNILDHWGYGSITAKNGKEAVDMAVSQLPDLVFPTARSCLVGHRATYYGRS